MQREICQICKILTDFSDLQVLDLSDLSKLSDLSIWKKRETDQQTDIQTDRPTYRDAWTHQKKFACVCFFQSRFPNLFPCRILIGDFFPELFGEPSPKKNNEKKKKFQKES